MPDPTGQNIDPSLMEEMLRQRGLIATGGNIRPIPFAGDNVSPPASGSMGVGGAGASGAANIPRPPGATPIVGPNNTLLDPSTNQPLDPQSSDSWWKYLLGGAGVVGGGMAAAALLKNRKGVPYIEGETLDPLAPNAAPDAPPVEGEYTNVPNSDVPNVEPQRGLPPPATAIEDARTQAQLPETAKALGARKRATNPSVSSDTSVVRGSDSLSDFTPEEIARARQLAQQLVAERVKGNRARAKQTNLTRRGGKPTGPTEEEGLLNTVIRLLREGGALRSLSKAVP